MKVILPFKYGDRVVLVNRQGKPRLRGYIVGFANIPYTMDEYWCIRLHGYPNKRWGYSTICVPREQIQLYKRKTNV